MSNRDLTQCEWCLDYLRDTYFNVVYHNQRCRGKHYRLYWEREQLPKPYKFECRECYCLLLYLNQKHNCPCPKL